MKVKVLDSGCANQYLGSRVKDSRLLVYGARISVQSVGSGDTDFLKARK